MRIRVCSACVALALVAVGWFASVVHAEESAFQLQNGLVGADFATATRLEVSGDGEITHLGKTRVDGTGHWVERLYDSFKVVGVMVFYAANGDEVHAVFTGTVVGASFDYTYADLTLTFIGGTGRFANPTGGAELLFSYDPAAGDFGTSSIEGTIDY
jgi:hypothetical protein